MNSRSAGTPPAAKVQAAGVGLVVTATLLIALAGCDVFLAGKCGRWNPNDPKNELSSRSMVLTPVLDGFVHGNSLPAETYNSVFEETFLQYDRWDAGSTGYCYTLMLFDLASIPADASITAAGLTLHFDLLASGGEPLEAARIVQTWDPATVEFVTIDSAGFVGVTPASAVLPAAAPGSVTIDIRLIVDEWRSGFPISNYGLRIRAWSGGAEIRGASSEQGTLGPRLSITYLIPE